MRTRARVPPCPATPSARCSASPRSANRTVRRSAASSTAVRPDWRSPSADIQHELDRRKPGTSRHVTQRREPDTVEILSGVFEGRTTGTPIALLIRNEDARSKDYAEIADTLSSRSRRLHVLAEVRHSRLSRRRPAVGARNGGARRRRRDRAQVAARALRRAHSRPPRAARPATRSRSKAGKHVDDEPVLRRQRDDGRASSRRSWTRCASRATRSARASTVVAMRRAGRLGRAGLRQARCRHRARDDEHQRGEGRGDRRRLRERRADAAPSTPTR